MGAIRSFVTRTQDDYARRNEEFRGLGFEVDDQDVLPLFDVPYLLKGLRNSMLK
jgi:hypothetical protein